MKVIPVVCSYMIALIASQPSHALRPLAVPITSPATGLTNHFFDWKGQSIRYQCAGPTSGEPLLLVHGLFVNSDHWRKSLKELSEEGFHVFAVDLFGCGYSDKPPRDSEAAQKCNGERGRFDAENSGVLENVRLGTASGGDGTFRRRDVNLRHPLSSPYNFYTWSSLLCDFVRDVILTNEKPHSQVTLVSNSIGTISAFQAVLDEPELYTGVFVVCPNFRELHSAEIGPFSMPIIRLFQYILREFGQPAFDRLAVPGTVKQILKEPYAITSAVDDTLVQVLLDPLLTPGSSDVVFDLLSYSAGPLPEQQLQSFPLDKPVWVCYGKEDPWTPPARVEGLKAFSSVVERVEALEGVGHCPHDESPELVHPLIIAFLNRIVELRNQKNTSRTKEIIQ